MSLFIHEQIDPVQYDLIQETLVEPHVHGFDAVQLKLCLAVAGRGKLVAVLEPDQGIGRIAGRRDLIGL